MLGAEMTLLDEATKELLLNPTLIRAQQYGENPTQLFRNENEAGWMSTDSENGNIYVALFNLSEEGQEVNLEGIELPELLTGKMGNARDIWSGETVTKLGGKLPAHGSVFYEIK